MPKVARLTIVLLFVLSLVMGCSSYSKSVRTETVQYPVESDYRVADTYGRSQEPVVVEKRTEETATETRRESGGLLSGAVHVVGETLALPFRAVGGLLGVIF